MVDKKKVVVPLSWAMDFSFLQTVQAFHRLGVGYVAMVWKARSMSQLIDRHRYGEIAKEVFIQETKKLFPILQTKTDEAISQTWCAGLAYPNEIQFLQLFQKNKVVVITFGSLPLHTEFFLENYRKRALEVEMFSPASCNVTFKDRTLEREEKINRLKQAIALDDQIENVLYVEPKRPTWWQVWQWPFYLWQCHRRDIWKNTFESMQFSIKEVRELLKDCDQQEKCRVTSKPQQGFHVLHAAMSPMKKEKQISDQERGKPNEEEDSITLTALGLK